MKPQLLIVGTYHFASELDTFTHTDAFDVNRDQAQIKALLKVLAGFEPTALAIEITKDKQELVDGEYQSFLDSNFKLSKNEVHQVMYRLGDQLNLNKVHAVDWMDSVGNRNIGEIIEWAKEHQSETYEEMMGIFSKQSEQIKNDNTIIENLKNINQESTVIEGHRGYMKLAQIGEATDYIGIDWLRWWYQRNLIIYNNLMELVQVGHEKILLFIGSGHVYLIKQFLEESKEVEVLTFNDIS